MIDHYDWPGGHEAVLRFGPSAGPVVIALPPLFEEANRTRAFLVTTLRALADRGIASLLPDLPGTGESLTETENISLSHWSSALIALTDDAIARFGAVHAIAIRGGTLLGAESRFASRWHFAPVAGESLVKDLLRSRLTTDRNASDEGMELPGPPLELAGNLLSREVLHDLRQLDPVSTGPLRTVRLDSDGRSADRHVSGTPLWRRSEPDNDPAFARLLAEDIATWIATCGG